MLEQFLSGDRSNIIANLTRTLGVSEQQANGFFSKAIELIQGYFKSPSADPNALISGGTSGLVSKLDVGQLAGFVGGDRAKAQQGLTAIVEPLISKLKSDPAAVQKLLAQFEGTGVVETVKRAASKAFGGQA